MSGINVWFVMSTMVKLKNSVPPLGFHFFLFPIHWHKHKLTHLLYNTTSKCISGSLSTVACWSITVANALQRKHINVTAPIHTTLLYSLTLVEGKSVYTHSPRSLSQIFSICSGWRYFSAVLSNSSISLVGDSMSETLRVSTTDLKKSWIPSKCKQWGRRNKWAESGCRMWLCFPLHSHLHPQLRQAGRHPSYRSVVYMREWVWLKLSNTALCRAWAGSCDSREKAQLWFFSFSLSSLSLVRSVLSCVSTGVLEPCHALPATTGCRQQDSTIRD